jgi:hypothetical protein
MKYCQSPRCHYYNTNDRLKGSGGDKNFQTRKRSKLYFGGGNFCTLNCQNDWFEVYGSRAIEHFGRITTPKKRDKNIPNFWALRNQVVDRLYGTNWNWQTNVDWTRVSQEIDIIINQSTN